MPVLQEYLNIEEATDEDAAAGQDTPVHRSHLSVKVALPAGAALVIAALATLALLPRQALRAGTPAIAIRRWEEDLQSTQCGVMENNTDYVEYSGWGTNMDHIPGPDMCCAFCQAEPRCKSFVWVADAKLPGCPSQCWLKGGKPVDKKSKEGVVGGIPPPRKEFVMTPQEPSPDEYPPERTGMFCFVLMLPFGYEPNLMAWHYNHQVGIFNCDKYMVYTNKSMEVGTNTGLYTHVVDSDLHCGIGGDSQSALNSWIFIALWKKVLDDGYWREYPWTVKADPDTVFFPGRLRPILMQYYGEPYLNNCRYGMHGPIEVFGQPALSALQAEYDASFDGKAPKACVEKLHFGQWGEDMFIDQCMRKVLQVTNGEDPALVPELMCEAHCDCPDWYWCSGNSVAYHPFKSIDSYQNCLANAMASGDLLQ